jgi:cytochrome subunit of sulfide dehydrogenase
LRYISAGSYSIDPFLPIKILGGMMFRNPITKTAIAFGSLLLTGAAFAQTATPATAPTAARYLAANCANCHGTDGKASQGGFNLAGLPRDYIVAQMAAFKSGARQATIMHQISKGYTDAQIAAMADYFSKQKPGS